MAKIELKGLRHSYQSHPTSRTDYALQTLDLTWADGGAYALLGPSGCGKSTLLNIISGLLHPSEGRICFDGRDVTDLPPEARHIAQVFQFPVVYDTMTVFDNLAFPLRNRGVPENQVRARVQAVAEMIDLGSNLKTPARKLGADGQQKVSLGRGLVREDVHVIMFDEPLTVIDPHLKWQIRSKLRALHRRIQTTMIYVTHYQTEALTFADEVVVMNEGEVLQVGTPLELFERPRHTFVGYFIGSPGMNILPAHLEGETAVVAGHRFILKKSVVPPTSARLEIGVRPEFVRFSSEGLPVEIEQIRDAGRHRIVDVRAAEHRIQLIVDEDTLLPTHDPCVTFDPDHTHLYADGWLAEDSQERM